MSAIAYAYSIYPWTDELVMTITERLALAPDAPAWHRDTLRARFDRHVAALIDAVPFGDRPTLSLLIDRADMDRVIRETGAVRAVIDATPDGLGDLLLLMGASAPTDNSRDTTAATAFATVLARGLADAAPGVEAAVRDILLRATTPVTTGTTGTTAAGRCAPAPAPVLDERELAVLEAFRDRHPVLLKNVDVEEAADLSKQTVGDVVAALIGKGLVSRPRGRRKGATLTPEGIALVDRIRNSSTDHP